MLSARQQRNAAARVVVLECKSLLSSMVDGSGHVPPLHGILRDILLDREMFMQICVNAAKLYLECHIPLPSVEYSEGQKRKQHQHNESPVRDENASMAEVDEELLVSIALRELHTAARSYVKSVESSRSDSASQLFASTNDKSGHHISKSASNIFDNPNSLRLVSGLAMRQIVVVEAAKRLLEAPLAGGEISTERYSSLVVAAVRHIEATFPEFSLSTTDNLSHEEAHELRLFLERSLNPPRAEEGIVGDHDRDHEEHHSKHGCHPRKRQHQTSARSGTECQPISPRGSNTGSVPRDLLVRISEVSGTDEKDQFEAALTRVRSIASAGITSNVHSTGNSANESPLSPGDEFTSPRSSGGTNKVTLIREIKELQAQARAINAALTEKMELLSDIE